MEFAWIKPGRITMRTLESEIGRGGDESPSHELVLTKGFYLERYEVTHEH